MAKEPLKLYIVGKTEDILVFYMNKKGYRAYGIGLSAYQEIMNMAKGRYKLTGYKARKVYDEIKKFSYLIEPLDKKRKLMRNIPAGIMAKPPYTFWPNPIKEMEFEREDKVKIYFDNPHKFASSYREARLMDAIKGAPQSKLVMKESYGGNLYFTYNGINFVARPKRVPYGLFPRDKGKVFTGEQAEKILTRIEESASVIEPFAKNPSREERWQTAKYFKGKGAKPHRAAAMQMKRLIEEKYGIKASYIQPYQLEVSGLAPFAKAAVSCTKCPVDLGLEQLMERGAFEAGYQPFKKYGVTVQAVYPWLLAFYTDL